jgi:hypothetical protein
MTAMLGRVESVSGKTEQGGFNSEAKCNPQAEVYFSHVTQQSRYSATRLSLRQKSAFHVQCPGAGEVSECKVLNTASYNSASLTSYYKNIECSD